MIIGLRLWITETPRTSRGSKVFGGESAIPAWKGPVDIATRACLVPRRGRKSLRQWGGWGVTTWLLFH